MGVNAISLNQQITDGSSTNVHIPTTTLPTSGYASMSGSATGSGRSSHPRNIEDLEESDSEKPQLDLQNESRRRMTGDWSGDNENREPDEDISNRAWKSEEGSPGESAVASLSRLNLELDAFLTSRDDQISLSDPQNQNDSGDMNENVGNVQLTKTSTHLVDLLQDGTIRGYLFSSSPSFDQGSDRLPDLSSFKPSEHHLGDQNASRSFSLIHTSIFDSDSQPSWSLSFSSKNDASQPDALCHSEFSQPPPKPRRTSQVLTTREEDTVRLTPEPIQFERNELMKPSLGEIIQMHMDSANILNPITSISSQRTDSPGITQSANENNNYGIAYSPNATTASLLDSRPYGAALILPTATQLSLDISLDRDLSFTYTTSIFSTATNTITGSSSVPGV
ncbi:unnamed protein product [Heterobilharzia americana]|nr:unnamed protein product [Heterobilharzia americana]